MIINYLRVFTLCLFSSFSFAQKANEYSYNSFAEKIYLQFDNEVYTTNKTIWFKAIVSNAVLHSPEFSSGVLYVDLINSKKEIVQSKIIKIEKGIGSSFFDLDRSYDEGNYMVRAYTQWNKNFGSDFMFKKPIQIYSENNTDFNLKPVQNLRRTDSTSETIRLKADIFPEHIDSYHKNERLKLMITQDGIKDSVELKRGRNGIFDFNYLVKKSTKYMTLEFMTHNKKHYHTTFLPNNSLIDLQFFPEGGKLIHGITSKVGFKAIGSDGKGKYVTGIILDSEDRIVSNFESNILGMGHFVMKDVDSSLQYRAQFKSILDSPDTLVSLPKIFGKGVTMSASWSNDVINVLISSNDKENKQMTLKASCRGYTYFEKTDRLVQGKSIFSIPKKRFPEGIISLTLTDIHNIPIAQRIIFNDVPENRINIQAFINKDKYKQREKVKLSIKTVDFKKAPVIASLSGLVVQKELFDDLQNLRENILSYFLMSSDLKGTIETPGAYFNNTNTLDIDDLLLTQGWTNYKYTKLDGNIKYEMEQKLKVSGVINPKKANENLEELELMLMTFDEMKIPYIKNVFVPGSFSFELDDIYGSEKDVLIQPASGLKEDRKNYTIALSKKKAPPIRFENKNSLVINDSIVNKMVSENRKQNKKETDFYFSNYGRTLLDEVVVDTYKITPERQEMFDTYGKPDVVIDGEEIVEKTADWSYGLYSVLRNSFWDQITILREGRDLKAQIFMNEVTLVVVDGIPVLEHNYPLIQYLSPEEIVSFEVIKFPKNFNDLYSTVYPYAKPPFPDGSIISIYTKIGKGLFGGLRTPNDKLDLTSIPVFAIEKEFYTPKYDSDDNTFNSNTLDLRAPLYWSPEVTTDTKGKALIEYYNSDIQGDFTIIIEAITDTGLLGYKLIEYKVKESVN
nr:hypothetical protein [uncultured Psychroserpens sp.]